MGPVTGSATNWMAGAGVVGQDPNSNMALPVPAQCESQGPAALLQHLEMLLLGTIR